MKLKKFLSVLSILIRPRVVVIEYATSLSKMRRFMRSRDIVIPLGKNHFFRVTLVKSAGDHDAHNGN